MTLKIEQADLASGVHKVTLIGALDITGAGQAEKPLSEVSKTKDKVILEMTEVTFLASVGIRVLVMTARTISRRRGRFVLFGVSSEARRVLKSTGIDEIIPTVASEAEAVAECNK